MDSRHTCKNCGEKLPWPLFGMERNDGESGFWHVTEGTPAGYGIVDIKEVCKGEKVRSNFSRVAIVGSRRGISNAEFTTQMEKWVEKYSYPSAIITGGAQGVDSFAEAFAKEKGIHLILVPANWAVHGKGAGFYRNSLIVALCGCVIAFHINNSKGTQDTINKARQQGKYVYLYTERDL